MKILPRLCSAFDYDTENMNSEDIYSSLKGVTEAIQNFSVRSQEDMNDPVHRREGEEVSCWEQDINPYLHCIDLLWLLDSLHCCKTFLRSSFYEYQQHLWLQLDFTPY